MPDPSSPDPKLKALDEQGTLNPRPEDVKDALFQGTWALGKVDPLSLNINDPGVAQHFCTDMTTISVRSWL